MTWWLSRSKDLLVIVEIIAVWTLCDHKIKCYHNNNDNCNAYRTISLAYTHGFSLSLKFSVLNVTDAREVTYFFLIYMRYVTSYWVFNHSDFVCITWIQGHRKVSGIGLHETIQLPINQLRLNQNETRFSSFLSVVFYHLSSQLNLTSSITSHRFFFWLMKVLWASFIRLSSHGGRKFQQKTCHSLAPAILCWFEGQTTPLKMITTELIFLLIIPINSTQKFELKLGKPDLARVVVFVLLRFVCCIYVVECM